MKKFILTVIALLFAAAVGFGGYAFYTLNQTMGKMQQATGLDTQNNGDEATNNGEAVNYLLLGTDTGELGRDYKGRTDTLMVLTINPKTNQSRITSIPRDTMVNYQGSTIKINAAYAYGSAGTAVSTVQDLLGIELTGYALINMGGLSTMVDAVGGVDVVSPLSFTYEGTTFVEGQSYHMDGATALKFSRMRYDDPRGDYGRQERQQLIIQGVVAKSQNISTLFNDSLLTAVADNVRTDISINSMKNLALKYRKALNNMEQDQLQGQTQMINGESFEVVPDSEIQRVQGEINQLMAQ
jgi:LCP family protein required for cell wall assembly